jgi:hypothetical protein
MGTLVPETYISIQQIEARNLAWDEERKLVWLNDASTGHLWSLNAASGKWNEYALGAASTAGPITVATSPRAIWVVNRPGRTKHEVGAEQAASEVLRFQAPSGRRTKTLALQGRIRIRPPAGSGDFRGLAWSRSSLWLASGTGLCSSICKVDATTGREVLAFFPRCQPTAIAIDPSETELWIAADNRPNPALLFLRSLSDEGGQGDSSTALRTRYFFALPSGVGVDSLAVSQRWLWVLDARARRIMRFTKPATQRGEP